jgi:transketolase N-terminal domain/subunit
VTANAPQANMGSRDTAAQFELENLVAIVDYNKRF